MGSPRTKNPALQGVQWQFLSSDVTSGVLVKDESQFDNPMTDEARRRIAYLEQALASTQDLDSQYQSFLMEAGKHAPGGNSDYLAKRSPVSPRTSDLVDGVDLWAQHVDRELTNRARPAEECSLTNSTPHPPHPQPPLAG